MEQSNTVNEVLENKLDRLPAAEYNYDRYTRGDAMMDIGAPLRAGRPGCLARFRARTQTAGGRLSDLRGRPVILRFEDHQLTCHHRLGRAVQNSSRRAFDIFVRQPPGTHGPPHTSYEQKMSDGDLQGIRRDPRRCWWTDLEGRVNRYNPSEPDVCADRRGPHRVL